MTPIMNADPAADLQHSRDMIVAELATVLRNADTSTTNIESAIARTNFSVQLICAIFGGKRELVLEMASQLSDSMCASLITGSTKPDLRQRLLEFGHRVIDVLATTHWRSLYRIAMTESIRHTGLARDFHEVGPGRLTQRLADFLRIAQGKRALGSGDPRLLASHFLALLRANLDATETFSQELAVSPVARDAYVRNVVELFCRGINGGKLLC